MLSNIKNDKAGFEETMIASRKGSQMGSCTMEQKPHEHKWHQDHKERCSAHGKNANEGRNWWLG